MTEAVDASAATGTGSSGHRLRWPLRRRAGIREQRRRTSYRDYVIRRMLKLPVMLLLLSMVVFILTRLGGSPASIYITSNMTPEEIQQIEARYHLDDSLVEQYLSWLGGVLRGDLGWSGVASAPVSDVLWHKLSATLELGILAGAVALFSGVALGTFGGARRDRAGDHATRVIAVLGASVPMFWFALLALYYFYLVLGVAPIGRMDRVIYDGIAHPTGFYTIDALIAGDWTAFRDALSHLWLPVLVLGYAGTAEIARIMRSSLVDELGSDYVDAARAKGLPERIVVRRHARRNALIPTITMMGIALGGIIQGTVVIELIFQTPGMGRWITDAVLRGDQATIMAFVLVIGAGYLIINLCVDLAYAHVDRRIELGA
jgi:peptide/nickel transport system permease protein